MSVMSQHQVRRVPVLDDDQLVGIIAQTDLAIELGNAESGQHGRGDID